MKEQIQRILNNNKTHNQDLKTEKDIVDKIDFVVDAIAKTFVFNEHTIEDIKQIARIAALEGLEKYDTEKKPLANFLYVRVKTRLLNFWRDNYVKSSCPCKICKNANEGHTNHPDGRYCEVYKKWLNKLLSQQNIKSPLDISLVEKFQEVSSDTNTVDNKDVLEKIDKFLPVSLRKHYLQLKSGIKLSRKDKALIEEVLKEIIRKEVYDYEQ